MFFDFFTRSYQSKEYIEKIAKEKLSLVYPDEILFKSDGD